MTLLSIFIALALEQFRPLPLERVVRAPLARLAAFLEQHLNDGIRLHGGIAWGLGAALPAAVLLVAHAWLKSAQPLLALLAGLGVLYLTMGFRQFSHFFTDIHVALRAGEIDQARKILAAWRGQGGDSLSSSEVARLAIEQALPLANRHVFAPLFWFVLLGPAGALLYRLAHLLDESWNKPPAVPELMETSEFGWFAQRAFAVLNWLPVRITAATFAVAGDFEDAVNCWRTQAARWPDQANGILLASGAGALGVRLGMPVHGLPHELNAADERPELGLGDEADAGFMQSTIGLVWRSLVLCLTVLALVQISAWVGG
jgi:adenosylcobinamide-phosphate synthase